MQCVLNDSNFVACSTLNICVFFFFFLQHVGSLLGIVAGIFSKSWTMPCGMGILQPTSTSQSHSGGEKS